MEKYLAIYHRREIYRENYAGRNWTEYETTPLVILNIGDFCGSKEMFLDWYAKEYAMERDKLIGVWFNMADYNPNGATKS